MPETLILDVDKINELQQNPAQAIELLRRITSGELTIDETGLEILNTLIAQSAKEAAEDLMRETC